MKRELAFQIARKLIGDLPKVRREGDFWAVPDSGKSGIWSRSAEALFVIAQSQSRDIQHIFLTWASDAAAGAGDLDRCLSLLPIPDIGKQWAMQANKLLVVKLTLGLPPNASDILGLVGPKVTKFALEHLPAISQYIEIRLSNEFYKTGKLQQAAWIDDAHTVDAGYVLFSGQPVHVACRPPGGWHFTNSPSARLFCNSLIREAENTWREEMEIPLIGQGWIAETHLFKGIVEAFPALSVVQHARPKWLGRQHLDIFINEMSVGIEYHGAQHDRPVAFFGGEEAYQRTVERDLRKLRLCKRHGVRLIYVREGYDLAAVVEQIKSVEKGLSEN